MDQKETPGQLSNIEKMAVVLDQLGPYYGDLYRTASSIFPQLTALNQTAVWIDPQSDILAGGLNKEGKLVIHLGTAAGSVTDGVKKRIIRRLKLPQEALSGPEAAFMRIVFTHEIGHILQADPKFEEVFGPIDRHTYRPEVDGYQIYVQSDREVNADYIAASIVGNSEFGKALKISPPKESPHDWRVWGKLHP